MGKRWFFLCILIIFSSVLTNCAETNPGNDYSIPVLNDLRIKNFSPVSIEIERPTLSVTGFPKPTIKAYIGVNGTIILSGNVVSNYITGGVDVSSEGYQFMNLKPHTSYRIIVVAQNNSGYSTKLIIQDTSCTTPVLNELAIAASDGESITLQAPTFSTAGNPEPTVQAYIGLSGTIKNEGQTVNGYEAGPVDVSKEGYKFSGLDSLTEYKIIVVASNSGGYSLKWIIQSTKPVAPLLQDLSIGNFDKHSITLDEPKFVIAGNPAPTVRAYIGINGTISVSGKDVSNSIAHYDYSLLISHQFTSLELYTAYRIIVVAENSVGYSVKQIVQSTSGIIPVLNDLSTDADATSITLAKPTFSTAGNPAPTVRAYIGLYGTISVNGSDVTGNIGSWVDVSTGDHQFTGLNPNTIYKIIVVAKNNQGYSVKQIIQSTSKCAPVLNELEIEDFDSVSITLAEPTYSTAGNPAPTVTAYMGVGISYIYYYGVLTIVGYEYTTTILTSGSHQFADLDPYTEYKIIVVAENSEGHSVKTITQKTRGVAPVLNDLAIVSSGTTSTSITLAKPTFSTAGNPAPEVMAYIGLTGEIDVNGSAVTGTIKNSADISSESGDHEFSGLDPYTEYKIIVVAKNNQGEDSVKTITQKTKGIVPVLNDLTIATGTTSTSITLVKPTFSTAGNPAPAVWAYIGVNEVIEFDVDENGLALSGTILDSVDISSETVNHKFEGLASFTTYRIIVIAKNDQGYSKKYITQKTSD